MTPSHATAPLPELTPQERLRYSRHLRLPEVGVEGQRKLKAARVLIIGAGGLGSPLALYLAAAGVGTLGLVDFDVVDLTNLQRQLLHGTNDVGRSKLESARDRIRDINPHVHVEPHDARLTSANALRIFRDYDLVVDGSDNFPTRYLVNDACVLTGRRNVHGSVFRFEGQLSVFGDPEGPCYRCLHREPPPPGLVPDCAEGGVLGVLPGLVGTIQATETLKLILGVGDTLVGRLLLVDTLGPSFRTIRIRRDPACPACGTRELRELTDYESFCGTDRRGDAQADGELRSITPAELHGRLQEADPPLLLDVREQHEWEMARIPGARLVPLASLGAVIPTLDARTELVVYCKAGVRSAEAARQLREAGFTRICNLAGGILRWSEEVDPALPRY